MKKLYFLTMLLLLALLQVGLGQVNVTVDWGNQKGVIPTTMNSLNMWYSIDPAVKNNTKYQGYLKSLNLKMVRIHGWEMIIQGHERCWIDFPNQRWNVTAINNSLSGIVPNVGTDIVINIPGDVSFITTDDQYAAFCAELVRIVNIQLGYSIKYWEPQNERIDAWGLNKMVTRYNKCAVAMKAVDPTIKIGGPASHQPWWSETGNFLSQTKNNIDFVTYHHYGGGDGTVSNATIYNNAVSVGNAGGDVRSTMNSVGIPASTPLFLGETNIVWSWDLDPQGKMGSYVGAVFDAIVLQTAVVKGAIQSIQSWNDRDGAYGKLDGSDNPRPAFYNLQVASNNMFGNWFNSTTTDNTKVLSLAVDNAGKKAIMLINRSTSDQTVNLSFTGWSTTLSYTRHVIKTSYSTTSESWSGSSKSITIPSESVTYLVFSGGTIVPVTGITVNPTSASVNGGSTAALTATVVPANATN